jgi:ribitol 2-dehydrogenase
MPLSVGQQRNIYEQPRPQRSAVTPRRHQPKAIALAAHFPTPWEPVYASSKWAINCFVQTVRRQVFKHGIRVGSISPGPVISALLADWPPEKLKEAKESGSLLEASEVANVVTFMLTRPRGVTIRDVIMLPTNFDL